MKLKNFHTPPKSLELYTRLIVRRGKTKKYNKDNPKISSWLDVLAV
jgi:hypothetical protein